jgi:hypothetical protein
MLLKKFVTMKKIKNSSMDSYFKLEINEILNQLKDIDFSIPQ